MLRLSATFGNGILKKKTKKGDMHHVPDIQSILSILIKKRTATHKYQLIHNDCFWIGYYGSFVVEDLEIE